MSPRSCFVPLSQSRTKTINSLASWQNLSCLILSPWTYVLTSTPTSVISLMVETIVLLLQSLSQISTSPLNTKTSPGPTPQSRAWFSHSSLSSMASGKKTASKKMSWFLIFSILGTEIKDILGSRICDELCEDKRHKYDRRAWSALALEQLPENSFPTLPSPYIHPVH